VLQSVSLHSAHHISGRIVVDKKDQGIALTQYELIEREMEATDYHIEVKA
jgi:hypothetical protein